MFSEESAVDEDDEDEKENEEQEQGVGKVWQITDRCLISLYVAML